MSIDVFSQDLTVISYGRRASDGKVLIQYVINKVGFYYNIRFASRAYAPGTQYGFPMTPAIDDPEHDADPLIIATAGKKYTWVWDAPADGYPAINLTGWTIFLSYMNLYCCTLGDSVTRVPGDTGSSGAIGAAAAAPTVPVASPTAPATANPTPTIATPTSPATGTAPPTVPNTGFAATAGTPFGYVPAPRGLLPFGITTATATAAPAPTPTTNTPFGNAPGTFYTSPPTSTVPTQAPLPAATVPLSLYTQTYNDIIVDLNVFMVPSTSVPQDSVPMLFVFATPKVLVWPAGCKIYAEAMDSTGARYQFPSPSNFDEMVYNNTYGRGLCLHLNQFKVGAIKILVAFMSQLGNIIYSKVMNAEILSAGAIPTPSKQNQTFTPKILNTTGFNAFIEPSFEGSYGAVGDEDYFLITAVPNTSVVVKITKEAEETGFQPKLIISPVSNFQSQIVATTDRLAGTSEEDAASHVVGWKDTTGLLTTGQVYVVQVVHRYAFYSSKWAFKIYTNGTPVPTVASFGIDGGNLAGSITSGYGRQSLKIVNDRTHDYIYVRTGPDGSVTDVQTASPTGDTLAVSTGDRLRVYRSGMAALYRFSDLIKEVTL